MQVLLPFMRITAAYFLGNANTFLSLNDAHGDRSFPKG
jgi:hypothetical protein